MFNPCPKSQKRLFVRGLPLLLVSGVAFHLQGQSPAPVASQPDDYRISVDVGLVVLNPIVRDGAGRFVSDLHQQDFEVYEDGVRQAIRLFRHEDLPVTVGLVVDHSTSMLPKLTQVIEAARAFIRSSNPADEMFVVNFNENVTLGMRGAIRFTNRSSELEAALFDSPAKGMTALYDAVVAAHQWLQSGVKEKKILIVISDGGDNASKRALPAVLSLVERSSVVMYTIGMFDATDPDRNPGVLNRLAHITGGEAYYPATIDQMKSVCERIAHDIRNQYTIGYTSNNPLRPGEYRKIRVAAKSPDYSKLVVRARTGYTAGGK